MEDINTDFKVDITDIANATKVFGSYPRNERWDSSADFSGDLTVNILDVAMAIRRFG